jgi:hypothetical protein
MADLARNHGVPVEISAFETWNDTGRRFDLITCGDACTGSTPPEASPKRAA